MLTLSQGAASDGMRVSPLKLQFDAESNSALVKVSNGRQEKITVQLEALTWTQDQAGQDQYSATSEIVFFPRILNIKPSEQRVIRVGYQGTPVSKKEKAFRLYVQELPLQKPGEVEMKFAVRMGIPIFVSPNQQEAAWDVASTEKTEQGFNVRVENNGSHFVRIGAIEVVGLNSEGVELFSVTESGWYVLAGSGRDFVLPSAGEYCEQVVSFEVAVTGGNETRNRQLSVTNTDCANY
jgi:fimbrial chaperone protein